MRIWAVLLATILWMPVLATSSQEVAVATFAPYASAPLCPHRDRHAYHSLWNEVEGFGIEMRHDDFEWLVEEMKRDFPGKVTLRRAN